MNTKNSVIETGRVVGIVIFATAFTARARDVTFTPEITILLLDLAILAVLTAPLLTMVYPSVKTFSMEVKAIIAAVIFLAIFLSQIGLIEAIRKILSDPIIELALIAYAILVISGINKEHEIEISEGTVSVRDYDKVKPFIAPGLNVIVLIVAVIALNPNLELGFEEVVSFLYAELACVAIAIVTMAYLFFLPLIKRGKNNNTIKQKPNPA